MPANQHAELDPIGRRISRAARAVRAVLDASLADAGFTFPAWSVLSELSLSGPRIQRELAERLDIGGPALVERLDQLERSGLVVRRPQPGDRRATRVELTAAGEQAVVRVAREMQGFEAQLLAGLDPSDVAAARRVLAHVTARAGEIRASRG